jgi:tetratricopeptide (TPR) repeat protein
LVLWILVFFLPFPSALPAADEYQQLKNQLQSTDSVDSSLVEALPQPSTPEEYRLRAKVRDQFSAALEDLDRALSMADDASDTLLRDLIELTLLDDPSPDRLNQLKQVLGGDAGDHNGTVWLLAGKYAAYHDNYELALRWTERARSSSSIRSEALLDQALYQIELGRPKKASTILERFLLEHPDSFRPRYWNLRGRLSRETGNDSEAYIAHNQVVRNYPDSLEITKAEEELADLPLPDVFQPNGNRSASSNSSESSRDRMEDPNTERSPEPGDWQVQLGSFQDRSRARSFKRRMESRLDESLAIRSARVHGKRYFRVQILGFDSKYEASRQKDKLERLGIDAFILDG